MGKRNKKRPSSNCVGRSGILRDNPCADLILPSLVIQIHCGRWFIPWCNMVLLQVFCPVFNVGDSVGGNGDAVVRRRMTTNKRMTEKKWAVRWYPFLFRLASERISLPDGVKYPYTGCRLQYLLEDGGTVVFTFSTITLSVGYGRCCRQCLVGLQLSTVWLPTKPYLRSKRGLVGMLLSINLFYE